MSKKIPLDAKINLVYSMIDMLSFYSKLGTNIVPTNQEYKIASRHEDLSVEREARLAAFKDMKAGGIKKYAFDSSRVNQLTDRNPRQNLQYWQRSQAFVEEEINRKIQILAKLEIIAKQMEKDLGTQPEWHSSYARQLVANLDKVALKKEGKEVEVFPPHVSYLEQLLFNRYRLTLDSIKNASDEELKNALLVKDTGLKRKSDFLVRNNIAKSSSPIMDKALASNSAPQDIESNIIKALLSSDSMQKSGGDKIVERTITITIKDHVA